MSADVSLGFKLFKIVSAASICFNAAAFDDAVQRSGIQEITKTGFISHTKGITSLQK